MFLYLPIVVDGTGRGNASEYYLRRDERWDRIKSEAWTAELRSSSPTDCRYGRVYGQT